MEPPVVNGSVGYVTGLRRMVGNAPVILIGASVLVTDHASCLLLTKRADTGEWCLPGGFTELGESIEQTAVREVLEETGLTVRDVVLFDVFSGPELYHRYPNGDEIYNVTVAYLASASGESLQCDGVEALQAAFFSPDALPEPILRPERPILDAYLRHVREQ